MDDQHYTPSSSWKRHLTSYTGSKDEDRAEFIQNLAKAVEELRRGHEAKIRSQLKSISGQNLTAEKRTWLRNSSPDYQSVYRADVHAKHQCAHYV
ncbi:hypothetical protein CYMTET_45092 [Cymbomonas tetramitiformis]|uniref:Uncharacterized protein n=1 Tax=Cymbomonas tetramitiformis TaxID=36881 RepID=A0AAE0BL50_9CHLO|nr:hypothetical protein CYMTET_52209 [Cymbomonas tetramitiformis]KAK3245334.1 hypothetical protein CYMTET_45092 [Cymbomonas tetramitiformis]